MCKCLPKKKYHKKYWITANQGSQLLPAESRTFMLGAHVEL